jgi:hypothetical protein
MALTNNSIFILYSPLSIDYPHTAYPYAVS